MKSNPNIATIMYSASVVPVLSMVDTTTYEGVLEMRAVLLTYPVTFCQGLFHRFMEKNRKTSYQIYSLETQLKIVAQNSIIGVGGDARLRRYVW